MGWVLLNLRQFWYVAEPIRIDVFAYNHYKHITAVVSNIVYKIPGLSQKVYTAEMVR